MAKEKRLYSLVRRFLVNYRLKLLFIKLISLSDLGESLVFPGISRRHQSEAIITAVIYKRKWKWTSEVKLKVDLWIIWPRCSTAHEQTQRRHNWNNLRSGRTFASLLFTYRVASFRFAFPQKWLYQAKQELYRAWSQVYQREKPTTFPTSSVHLKQVNLLTIFWVSNEMK